MMNKENDHNLVKSAYLIGVLLLVIVVISSVGLFLGKEEGANEQTDGMTKTSLSAEEKRLIEERLSGTTASVGTLSEAEKQKIEANFNRKTSSGRISPEDEMRH